jgi:hypothetical protein
VLRQAKEALIGFAATYAETHPGQPQGYLPCPDHDGDGSADPACSCSGYSVIGRLPWKTLGLPPLRDGSGECLWYAVSGNYKDKPKSKIYTTPSNPNCSKKPSPIRTLTSDSDGLLRVKNTQDEFIAKDVIAIIFAPGKIIKEQNRAVKNGEPTECGSKGNGIKDPVDPINDVENYLDHYTSGVDINNATGNGPLSVFVASESGNSGFFAADNDPDVPSSLPTFISAPLTYGTYDDSGTEKVNTGEVIFNDTLMLITPKDYAPVYKRMDFWVAERVTQCLKTYGENFRDFLDKHKDIIGDAENPATGTYRKFYSPKKYIKQYVAVMEAKYRADFHKQHRNEEPMPEPNQTDIDEVKKKAKEDAIDIDSQYPWATLVDDDQDYTESVGQRFGRIPQDMSNSNATNIDIIKDWEKTTLYGKACFDESSGLDNFEWGWWTEWKEMVFYAVDDDYVPNQAYPETHIWVKAIKTQEDNGEWVDWVAWLKAPFGGEPDSDDYNGLKVITPSDVQTAKINTFAKIIQSSEGSWEFKLAPGEIPSSLPTTLQLGDSTGFEDAQFVVLVAGRRLHLNKNSSEPSYTEYPQIRNDDSQKGKVKNYLEGKAKPLDPVTDNDPNDPNDPDLTEMLRQIDGGGNIPVNGESDTIPSGDEIFIKKPIVPNYFNDVSCIYKYDDTFDCTIPR